MSSERAKKKAEQEHLKQIQELLDRPENQTCCDCGARGPRWASTNIGCFLCIRCAGLHRKLGTHISKVKSATLDSWTPEQMQVMSERGNGKVNAKYLGTGNAPPPPAGSDAEMELYCRNKYEKALYSIDDAGKASNQSLAQPHAHAHTQQQASGPQRQETTKRNDIYAAEMHSLRAMGFNDDNLNNQALQLTKGDIQAAVDYILQKGQPLGSSKSNASNQSSAFSNSSASNNANAFSNSSASNNGNASSNSNANNDSKKSVFQATQRQAPTSTSRFPETIINQLNQMGFTNDEDNSNALLITDGNVEKSVALLLEWRKTRQQNAVEASPRRPGASRQAQQKQPHSAQNPLSQQQTLIQQQQPNNDLADLFGYPAPKQLDFTQNQGNSNAAQQLFAVDNQSIFPIQQDLFGLQSAELANPSIRPANASFNPFASNQVDNPFGNTLNYNQNQTQQKQAVDVIGQQNAFADQTSQFQFGQASQPIASNFQNAQTGLNTPKSAREVDKKSQIDALKLLVNAQSPKMQPTQPFQMNQFSKTQTQNQNQNLFGGHLNQFNPPQSNSFGQQGQFGALQSNPFGSGSDFQQNQQQFQTMQQFQQAPLCFQAQPSNPFQAQGNAPVQQYSMHSAVYPLTQPMTNQFAPRVPQSMQAMPQMQQLNPFGQQAQFQQPFQQPNQQQDMTGDLFKPQNAQQNQQKQQNDLFADLIFKK